MTESATPSTRDESVIYQIVKAIADTNDSDIHAIAPLHNSVDAQALEDIFTHSNPHLRVDFRHEGWRVIVRKRGDLDVQVR